MLAVLAAAVGISSGLIGALFHFTLDRADHLRMVVVTLAHESPWPGLALLVGGSAAATALAASLVRRVVPSATGSGIPRVEASLDGELSQPTRLLIPVKFAGGVLAIGSGLALGREGPTIQMGAAIASQIGRTSKRNWQDQRALIAGGAGAGLTTAFNSPGAGCIFVLEELVGRFEPRIAVVALGSSVGAIFVSRWILGSAIDLPTPAMASGGPQAIPLFLLLGVVVGLATVAYNRSLLGTLRLADRIGGPVELRAAVIGAAVGLLAYVAPDLVGGGESIATRMLHEHATLAVLPGLFLLRLVLSTVSYAAATPGGLFAPMLALGTIVGLAFGLAVEPWADDLGVSPAAFTVVGMGAFFAGAVRAPLTGIVLTVEMTGSSSLLLPLLSACFGAMLVTQALRDPPIYASLRKRAALEKR